MRFENLGPVANPDGSPTDLTREMLAGTGRDPDAFAAGARFTDEYGVPREDGRDDPAPRLGYVRGDGGCDGEICRDWPHVVLSTDPDDWSGSLVVWGVLPTHLDYEAALPALDEYAEETDGVETLFVRVTRIKAGTDLAAETRRDLAGMQEES
jgi:hypothetical protein